MEISGTALARELSSVAGACLLAIGLAGPIALRCQSLPTQPLEFEVASVKLHLYRLPMMYGTRPRQLTSHGTYFTDQGYAMQEIIMQAFDLQDYQVLGLPEWAKRKWATPNLEYYDIDARTPNENPTIAELRGMLQSLLAERCRLTFHWEEKQLPVYALVIAKGGLKSKEMPAGSGYSTVYLMIQELSMFLDRPIVDHTGLEGEYDFAPPGGLARARADPMTGASEVSASLEDRAGLKLEPRKEATKVLVVGHIERPSPN